MASSKRLRARPTAEQKPVPPAGFGPLVAGLRDMSVLFDVYPRTPDTWQTRGQLPMPDGVVSGRCAYWLVSRLEVWAHNMNIPIYPERLIEARERGETIPRRSPTPGRKGDNQGPLTKQPARRNIQAKYKS